MTMCKLSALMVFFAKRCCGVATIGKLLELLDLFCKRALQKEWSFSIETYPFVGGAPLLFVAICCSFRSPTTRCYTIQTQEGLTAEELTN